MRAVIYKESLPIDHPDALLDVELPDPEPGPMDLLIGVEAVSVNPVDVTPMKRRSLSLHWEFRRRNPHTATRPTQGTNR